MVSSPTIYGEKLYLTLHVILRQYTLFMSTGPTKSAQNKAMQKFQTYILNK